MIIGITGSIGSGKTTAASLFKKHGFKVIDADKIAHSLMEKNSLIYKKLRNFFGDGILDKNKNIDREKLGDIVFNDGKTHENHRYEEIKDFQYPLRGFSGHRKSKGFSRELKVLNSVIHPYIIKEINFQKNALKEHFFENIVIDAPLLLEAKQENLVDKIIVVKASKENIFKRLGKKYSHSQKFLGKTFARSYLHSPTKSPKDFVGSVYPKEKIERILSLQMPLKEKLKHADFVIDNDKDLRHLESQVKEIISKL